MSTKTGELALECKRQSESCLYTSTSLFVWLKFLGVTKFVFTVTPLILGALATWKLLTGSELAAVKLFAAVCAFVAGLLPTIYSALKYDQYLAECRQLAGEFKNLQDGFRRAALVASKKKFEEFEAEFNALYTRLERARSVSLVAPEWCFKRAQKKIATGDYNFDVDINMKSEQPRVEALPTPKGSATLPEGVEAARLPSVDPMPRAAIPPEASS